MGQKEKGTSADCKEKETFQEGQEQMQWSKGKDFFFITFFFTYSYSVIVPFIRLSMPIL